MIVDIALAAARPRMMQPMEARPDQQPLAHPAEAHVDIGVRPAFDQPADHQDEHEVVGLDADELREHRQHEVHQQVVDHVVAVVRPDGHAALA